VVIGFFVSVVFFNNLIEKRSEGSVRIVGSSVDSDSRIDVLASREDAGLERNTASVFLVLEFIPDISSEVSHEG
jgi:hypothetical protein